MTAFMLFTFKRVLPSFWRWQQLELMNHTLDLCHSTAQHSTAQPSPAQPSSAQPAQHSALQRTPAQPRMWAVHANRQAGGMYAGPAS